jgi:hypothetical protein
VHLGYLLTTVGLNTLRLGERMVQMTHNVTMEAWGSLSPGQYRIHDRDGKCGSAFQQIIGAAGVKRVPLPARSLNLIAYAERRVRSVKDECLSQLMVFGERGLRHTVRGYVDYYHHERDHPGQGSVLLTPFAHSTMSVSA